MRTAYGSETDGSGYRLRRALPEEVREIYGWRYDGPYAFYDMSRNPGDLDQMPDPDGREKFYSVLGPESGLAGFFSFIDEGDGELTVGLGMRPDLTGRGLGERFVRRGLEYRPRRPRSQPLQPLRGYLQRAGDQGLRKIRLPR